jgi:chromosome segregation ATPase
MLDGAVTSTVRKTDVSFSALIDRLQEENAQLSHAIEEMRIQVSVELERRRHAERELEHLKDVNQRLQEESEANSSVAMRLKGVFDAQSQGLKSAVQELQALQEGLFMGT